MLSSVLNGDYAINVNIQIIRFLTIMRELLLARHDKNILLIFEYIKELDQEKQQEIDQQNRNKIGFKR